MDKHTKAQRSKNMAAVRSSGNKTTELRFVNILKANKISGWRRHPKNIFGKPDFIFPKSKIAIFIDGCFWHGCKLDKTIPITNKIFWRNKIQQNIVRDRKVSKILKSQGWKVLRIWEHELKNKKHNIVVKVAKILK